MTINVYNIYEKKTIVFLNFWFQFLYLKFVQLLTNFLVVLNNLMFKMLLVQLFLLWYFC